MGFIWNLEKSLKQQKFRFYHIKERQRPVSHILLIFCFCLLLISCGEDDKQPGLGSPVVEGLDDDTTPKVSKKWTWKCANNDNTCRYRYAVNKSTTHSFTTNDQYNSENTTYTKTITQKDEEGKYYIHVQAKNTSGESQVARGSAILRLGELQVTDLSNDTTPKASKTWTWSCINNSGPCTYRHVINQSSTHTFTSESFDSTTTAEKTITSSAEDGTYWIHVEAKDANGISQPRRVSAVLRFTTTASLRVTGLTDDTTPTDSFTWTWGCENNASTCEYRHAITKEETHSFTDNDQFNSTITAEKTITSSTDNGTYYIHVQARDSNETSSLARGSAVLQVTPQFILTLTSPKPHTNKLALYTDRTPTFEATQVPDGKLAALYYNDCKMNQKLSPEVTVANGKATLQSYFLRRETHILLGVRDSDTDTSIDCQKEGLAYIPYEPLGIGGEFSCYLFNHGRVACWGSNQYGQLGQGDTKNIGSSSTTTNDSKPMSALKGKFVNLGDNKLAKAISVGFQHVCAILDDDSAKCWGRNQHGQLGQGHTNPIGDGTGEMGGQLLPIDLGSNRKAISIAAGAYSTCVLLNNYQITCFGYNGHGQLGLGHTNSIGHAATHMGDQLSTIDFGCSTNTNPCPASEKYYSVDITSGWYHACALLTPGAKLKCWGRNHEGQLGQNNHTVVDSSNNITTNNNIGDHADRSVASAGLIDLGFTGNQAIYKISAGRNASCVLTNDKKAKCWGQNSRGQLGQNDMVNHGSRSDGGGTASGQNGICTAASGDNAKVSGEVCTVAGLPFINLGSSLTPRFIETGGHTCVGLNSGQAKCWGLNNFGQLGQNDTISHGSRSDGGGSSSGQNGICTAASGDDAKVSGEACTVAGLPAIDLGCHTVNTSCPSGDVYKVTFVTSGDHHTCAVLKTDNKQDLTDTLKCWGHNNKGQLGQDNTINNGATHPVKSISSINLAAIVRVCPLDKPYPNYNAVNDQCLPSCGQACSLDTGGGECQSGNACDDTTNYTIKMLTAYDQSKCCLRTAK